MPRAPQTLAALVCGALLTLACAARAAAPAPPADDAERMGRFARHFASGNRFVRTHRYAEAFDQYTQALALNGRSPDLYFNLATVAEALKRWDMVVLSAHAYVLLDPQGEEVAELTAKRARCLAVLGKRGMLAKLHVLVEPAEAQVFVQNVFVGLTPLRGVDVQAGNYTIAVRLEDHHEFGDSVTVPAGTEETVSGQLSAMTFHGRLQVACEPGDGVQVFLDDKLVGTTPLPEPLPLVAQRYLLRLEKAGYDRWVRYVQVPKNDLLTVQATLEATPPANPAPPGAPPPPAPWIRTR